MITPLSNGAVAQIKGHRVSGGAVITVTRADGRTRQHRVGLRRYGRLKDILAAIEGASGWSVGSGFTFVLRRAHGFVEARKWLERYYFGAPNCPKHWRPSAQISLGERR